MVQKKENASFLDISVCCWANGKQKFVTTETLCECNGIELLWKQLQNTRKCKEGLCVQENVKKGSVNVFPVFKALLCLKLETHLA